MRNLCPDVTHFATSVVCDSGFDGLMQPGRVIEANELAKGISCILLNLNTIIMYKALIYIILHPNICENDQKR